MTDINSEDFIKNMNALAPGSALGDVAAERQRQISDEGWSIEYDDSSTSCELAAAAATYALCLKLEQLEVCGVTAWPWPAHWWKPTTYRQNLVKAGALILAEIERMDRAARKAAAVQEDIPAADDGWIKWDHSEWPGPAGIYSTQLVWVLLEDDQTPRPGFAKDFDWRAEPAMARSRIIAYRLTEPVQP